MTVKKVLAWVKNPVKIGVMMAENRAEDRCRLRHHALEKFNLEKRRGSGKMKKIFAVLVLVLFGLVGNCFANGLMRDNMGTIPSGRGGTNLAYTDNGMVVYDNPSALTEVKGKTAELDFDVLDLMPHFKNATNDEDGDVWVLLPSMSYVQPLSDSLGIGVGVYHPAGCQTDYKLDGVLGKQEYSSYAALSELLVAVGWKPFDTLSIGVGIGPAYSKMKLKEPYTFQTGALAGAPALLDLKADATQVTWNVGLQWRVSKDTTIGMAYHPERKFTMKGDVDLDASAFVALMGLGWPDATAHYDVEYDLVWPETAGIGIAHQLTDALNVSAEFTWYGWSSAFDKMELKLSNGDNPYFDAATGTTTPQDTLPLEWDDSYSVRVGADYALTKNDTVRLGYVYEKNPIPSDTLIPVIPAICKHQIEAGYGHSWEDWTVSASYGYIFGPEQDITTSKLVGGEYNNSTVDFTAHFFSVGAQYRF